jgi:hypothetical protein
VGQERHPLKLHHVVLPRDFTTMTVSAESALQRTPDRADTQHVDREVPGRMLVVGETGRANAGRSKRQDGSSAL